MCQKCKEQSNLLPGQEIHYITGMKSKQYTARVNQLSPDEAFVHFQELQLPADYPSFAFLHGYLSAITTTPSQVAPQEWQEPLHEEVTFTDLKQSEALFDLLVPMFNGLLTQIEHRSLSIPDCISSIDEVQDWSTGFTKANREFVHLWDYTLDEIETKLEGHELGKELWEKLARSWDALSTASRPELVEQFRISPQFSGMTPEELNQAFRKNFQIELAFQAHTCKQLLDIRRRIHE